ncbi:hypothetical protein WJX73_009060 [Symbiochloris irregularis]|uniref:Uncharacterized protein n=1 Tax=Symbiochloris irregularis TaxID=706552 RepID=A0AAW1NVI8_9CHLO
METNAVNGPTDAQPSDEEIITRLRAMLQGVDMATTTERQLRKALEQDFGVDLSSRKDIIRAEVTKYLDEQYPAEEEEAAEEAAEAGASGADEDDEPEPKARKGKRRGGGGGFGRTHLSEDMQEFLGEESLPRTQIVKRLWAYIKENNLQNPKDKRKIVLDDKLSKLFKPPLTMFTINKQLGRHCKTHDGSADDDEDEDGDSAPAKKRQVSASTATVSRKKPKKESGEEGGKRKANSGFAKKLPLSESMAEWYGQPEAARSDLVGYFWKYVKENQLQDPANKQMIIADDKLFNLFGERKFAGFGVAKFLKPHFV